MAKIEIKGTGYSVYDMEVKVDGREIPDLKSLTLFLDADSPNEVHLTVAVDQIDIDAKALAALEGLVKKRSK